MRSLVHTTALGALVEPEVKSKKSGSDPSGALFARSSASNGGSVGRTASTSTNAVAGTPQSSPSKVERPAASVTIIWQSVWRTSRANSAPRRVGLMPTMHEPVSAAAPIQYRYSGVFSNNTPTCGLAVGSRCSRRNVARRVDSRTTSSQEVTEPSKT